MTNPTTPTPQAPLAVRLARVARPDAAWSVEDAHVAFTRGTHAGRVGDWTATFSVHFDLRSLDSLATCERRIVEAGHGYELRKALVQVMHKRRGLAFNWVESVLPWAEAEERAAALQAFLDARPEIERALTVHPVNGEDHED